MHRHVKLENTPVVNSRHEGQPRVAFVAIHDV
jgi:hypothetical protein